MKKVILLIALSVLLYSAPGHTMKGEKAPEHPAREKAPEHPAREKAPEHPARAEAFRVARRLNKAKAARRLKQAHARMKSAEKRKDALIAELIEEQERLGAPASNQLQLDFSAAIRKYQEATEEWQKQARKQGKLAPRVASPAAADEGEEAPTPRAAPLAADEQ